MIDEVKWWVYYSEKANIVLISRTFFKVLNNNLDKEGVV